ncbi:putative calcium transporter [Triangularia setosa]|uniref:Calcium transporter n=1 Tax=Triangularia setosa TaxID=2587417 RepID=A0AAN7A5D8_9PEZI|nr:putative calcium transporter [Podospora setosa]
MPALEVSKKQFEASIKHVDKILPDRIRTWARAKAHGPSPLTGGPSRSRAAEPGNERGEGLQSGLADAEKQSCFKSFWLTTRAILFSSIVNVLFVFVPVGFAVRFVHMPAGVVFGVNAVAIIPMASLLSHATESIAGRMGDTVGALMNVTFGNAVELIIFIIALLKNQIRIVQASLVGSILANVLLILGMCFLLGGLRFREQIYNSTVTQTSASLLALSVMSLLIPTVFHASFSKILTADDKVLQISRGTSVILLLVYLLYLVFQLKSHSYLYESTPQHIIEMETRPGPAAHYFHSSSSLEETDSDHNTSSDEHREDNEIRRARQETSSTVPDMTLGAPVSLRLHHTGSVEDVNADATTPINSSSRDGHESAQGSSSHSHKKPKSKKTRHHLKRYHSKRDLDSDGQTQPPVRRVAFEEGPSLESQPAPTSPRPLSFTFRQLPLFTPRQSGVTINSPSNLPADFPRRTRSLPLNRGPPASSSIFDPSFSFSTTNADPRPSTTSSPTTSPDDDQSTSSPQPPLWPPIILLVVSTALISLQAEFMISSITPLLASDSGLSEAFIGLILLPIVGNAAEHLTAVTVALKNKMDLAIGVAVGSSIQIALFVTPLVVILGWAMGKEMSLFFTLFETVCVVVSAFIVSFLVLDGRSNYLEGALLVAGYVMIAVAAFFYPDVAAANDLGGGLDEALNGGPVNGTG